MDRCKQSMFTTLQEFSVASTDYIKKQTLLAARLKGLRQEISIAPYSFMTYVSREKIVPTLSSVTRS